jgi:hypothetical protein
MGRLAALLQDDNTFEYSGEENNYQSESNYESDESEERPFNEGSSSVAGGEEENKLFLKKGRLNDSEDSILGTRIPLRASTAPARPLTDIEEFRRSSDFILLENAVMLSSMLKMRID